MAAKAQDAGEPDGDEEDPYYDEPSAFMVFLKTTPSWVASGVVHMILLIVLALIVIPRGGKDEEGTIVAARPEPVEEIEEDIEDELDKELDVETPLDLEEFQPDTENIEEEVRIDPIDDQSAALASVELDPAGIELSPRGPLLDGSFNGNATDGRGDPARRAALVAAGGGSGGSEKAVGLALEWLANHQMPDGGWTFDHRKSRCQGRCPDPGGFDEARNGATALALLPFLGAGHTHKKSKKYKQVVQRGLEYLGKNMKPDGSLMDGQGNSGMYSHGIAAICLCEVYAMTRDPALLKAAQKSVDFISQAQDPVGGGWRYQPQEKGDTSVVGWQIMALKSAHMSYLNVNPNTIKGATKFLDSVESNSGSNYGYLTPGAGDATTAIGLLCRMYLGWKHDNPALQRGIEFLGKKGPSDNMYYNYYATQVMRHYEGEEWEKWNGVMRDKLVNDQAKDGHKIGSWFYRGGDHGSDKGGRLYCTAMATMILEVYYRHLPIYQKGASEDNFPEG